MLVAKRPTMVGVHLQDALRDRLDDEIIRRMASKLPASECTMSVILRDALDDYLTRREILS